ncbi:MAG TPA: hypothetical protein VI259_17415 [Gemmatimonadaceae bacterium]
MKKRSFADIILTAVFLLISVNAWSQVVLAMLGHASSPLLTTMQILIGGSASAAAWGSWIGARWASTAALAYGLVSAAMLWALPLVLESGTHARPDFSAGAVGVALFAVAAAWYLSRVRA